jgi:pyridoxamine 5'-phosphate oxidase
MPDDLPAALLEDDLLPDPVEQFRTWFSAAAGKSGIELPETMVLATATADGAPSARAVLLKGVDERGFVFFTNYESRKARELAENPRAALVFLWGPLGRQVRVEGDVARLPAAESEAYFRTRPFGSRVGASASPQSAVVPSREAFEARVAELTAKYAGREDELPLPPTWGGFRIAPTSIEFWQRRDDRLHDRLRYRRADGGWIVERLAP